MESGLGLVLEALRAAVSQDPTLLKQGEAHLEEWEKEVGFYSLLIVSAVNLR